MTDPARSAALGRHGFTDPRAESMLTSLGWWPEVDDRLRALSRAADPDLALRQLDRIRESPADWPELNATLGREPAPRAGLFGLIGASSAFGDQLVAGHLDWRDLAAGGDDGLSRAVGVDGGRAGMTGPDAVWSLRLAYRRELARIAADDLAHLIDPGIRAVPFREVTERLSTAADHALAAALAVALAEVPEADAHSLAVIAMGKCGARELNYVSDVDVVFVAEDGTDLMVAERVAATVIRVAGAACFEVDAGLRPEGRAGALVRTLDGHLSYYRRWARTWEFQALLKARPSAGSEDLGRRYVEAVRPMVWTAGERKDFVEDVRAMRRRVEERVPGPLADRELKLGAGGLRDVEFAVQLLQLVHGRSDENLRVLSTVDALAALGLGGYVGRADAAGLVESYEFLRLLEHRLQLQRLLRTHTFPAADDVAGLRWLARAVGLRPDARRGVGEVLTAEYRQHRKQVRKLHEKLFYRPLLEAVASVPTEALRLTTKAASDRLSALGFVAPDGALRHMSALTEGVSRRAAIQTTLLPMLLDLFADTPDPDGGLLAYRKVSEALVDTPWYLRLLRDSGQVAQRLATLLGVSKTVPELLVRAPEVLRSLNDNEHLAARDPAEVALALRQAVARHPDPGRAVATARSLRRHEVLRVACAELLGMIDLAASQRALSSVWVAVLRAALDAVMRAGRPEGRLSVIGMGRLGGAELGYASDADVLFVCEPLPGVAEADALRWAGSVVERMRGLLGVSSQDPPLRVDADLRPEGRSGPLVRTLASYQAYYRRWSALWEAQALLRATPVAGDDELGARFVAMVDPIRYPAGGLDEAKVREIRRIKARVDHERLPRRADATTHTKLGRGGLADVEWTVQLLQLCHAHSCPELRTTSTVEGLHAAEKVGLLTGEDAAALLDGWLTAGRTRNAITLVKGRNTDQIPHSGRELAAVCRALGYPADTDPGAFVDEYRRTTRRARTVVEKVFYGD